jgi:hypothetical protein
MTSATLSRTPNAIVLTLPANVAQDEYERALDWVNAHVPPGSEGTFVDHGETHVWLFAAA